MDKEYEDTPSAKKQRVDESFQRVRKDTFVENMLTGVSTTLASDAEYGFNSSNRIRRRVEDITRAIDESGSTEDSISSSRAVLESRFALGADDSQYLSQCVSMLWAGDGGEKLRVAPLSSMPEIMRVASARGIVRAMGGIVKRQRRDATSTIGRALRMAGWLMQVEVIRNAIMETLEGQKEDTYAETALKVIRNALSTSGVETMTSEIINIHDSHGVHCAKSVIFAFLVLTNPGSMANEVVNHLVNAMNDVVERAESNLAQLFNTARAMEGGKERVYTQQDVDGENYTKNDETNPAFGHTNEFCNSKAANRQPVEFKQFATAVEEAVRRMCVEFKTINSPESTVLDTAEVVEDVQPRKTWYLYKSLSPMWNYKKRDDWAKVLRLEDIAKQTPKSNADASLEMRTVVMKHNRHQENYANYETSSLGSRLLDGRVIADEGFVQFCMIRGLCGFRGIHQVSDGGQDEVVKYDYPQTAIYRYNRGEFVSLKNLPLPKDIVQNIENCEMSLYNTDKMKLDTDFFANATKKTRSNMPLFSSEKTTSENFDKARRVAWIPMNVNDMEEVNTETFSLSVCKASVYEFMTLSLADPSQDHQGEEEMNLMHAAAAVAKLKQVHLNAVVKSTSPGEVMHSYNKMGQDVYVTRPCFQCMDENSAFDSKNLLLPVDAGIACFRKLTDTENNELFIPKPGVKVDETPKTLSDDSYFMSKIGETKMPNVSLSHFLSRGMENGWNQPTQNDSPSDTAQTIDRFVRPSKPYGLYIGASACAEPFDDRMSNLYDNATRKNNIDPDDLSPKTLFKTFVNGILACGQLEQIDCEEKYVKRFEDEGSKDLQEVFGIHRSIEDASRDRRADIWTDALREVAISGDRLYRFVTELTGAIGEAADSAVSWEDEDLKAMSKEASNRQKAMMERVSRFQTKLVESVVSSTLKASKLQLDVRNNAGNELVVINTDVKDGIRQITSGEAGHGFFEASVELNNLLGSASQPITIKQLVTKLRNVSMEFQEQLKDSLAASTPASFSRISEPRNSFMLHLKPDTIAAVHKAFDLITSEMRMCPGYHRHVYLWEYVEGKDWVLSSRFAELVGLMLQNTRMRSGSFAAYVGTSQIITNTQNVRMQIQRLKTQVCSYITNTETPQFLSKTGRTLYFGGSIAMTSADQEKERARIESKQGPAPFGGDSGDDWRLWSSLGNSSLDKFDSQESIVMALNDFMSKPADFMTSRQSMRAISDPRRQHELLRNYSVGQVMTAANQANLADFMTLHPKEWIQLAEVSALSALQQATAPNGISNNENDDCLSCIQKFHRPWVKEACKQYCKNTGQRLMQNTEKFPLPDKETIEGDEYYAVKFEAPDELLQREGMTIKSAEFSARINSTLNSLFSMKGSHKWTAHPSKDPSKEHFWIRKVNRGDVRLQEVVKLNGRIERRTQLATGGPRRLAALGIVVTAITALNAVVPGYKQYLCAEVSKAAVSAVADYGVRSIMSSLNGTTTKFDAMLPGLQSLIDSTGLPPAATMVVDASSAVYNVVNTRTTQLAFLTVAPHFPLQFHASQFSLAYAVRLSQAERFLKLYEHEPERQQVYKRELALLKRVNPLIDRIRVASEFKPQTFDSEQLSEIFNDRDFMQFLKTDFAVEVMENKLNINEIAGDIFLECSQLVGDVATTVSSFQACGENLTVEGWAKVLGKTTQQFQRNGDYVKSTLSTHSGKQYKPTSNAETRTLAPYRITTLKDVQPNVDIRKNMADALESLIQEKRTQLVNIEESGNRAPEELTNEIAMLQEFEEIVAIRLSGQIASWLSHSNGHAPESQAEMYPVWAFLSWPVLLQERFQYPLVEFFATIINEANHDSRSVSDYSSDEKYQERIDELIDSVPYFENVDRTQIRDILQGKHGNNQYAKIVESALASAFRQMRTTASQNWGAMGEVLKEKGFLVNDTGGQK